MNLSISTLGCPGLTLDEVIGLYKTVGVNKIEVRGLGGEMLPEVISEFSETNAKETRHKLALAGMTIIGFGTSVSFHDLQKYPACINAGKTAIDVCSKMGIPWIRVFGNKFPKNCDAAERKAVVDRVISGINELCAYGSDKNVSVLLETHGDFNTVETLGAVIDGVGSNDNFGIIWDVAHTDKPYGDDLEKVYDIIFDYVQHVHIKDHKRLVGEESVSYKLVGIGEGDIKIKEIIKRLIRDGYDGCFSYEWEKKWHPELEDCKTAFPKFVGYMKKIEEETGR